MSLANSVHSHKYITCDCESICIRVHKKHDCKCHRNSYDRVSKCFDLNEQHYYIRPQGIEISSPSQVGVLSNIDSCYDLVCRNCNCAFRVITSRKYAQLQIIQIGEQNRQNYIHSSCTLKNTFPFQLRPFIKINNLSQSLPLFEINDSSCEEEHTEPSFLDDIVEEIQPLLPIVGDIPSGFLVL